MVGLLTALPDTKLYHRLRHEKRILKQSSGHNTDFTMNFVAKMKSEELIKGYTKILTTIYSPKAYYARVKTFLREYRQTKHKRSPLSFHYMIALVKSLFYIGFWSKSSLHYWDLFFWTIFNRPGLIANSITLTIYGFHFRKIIKLNLKRLKSIQVS